MTDEPRPPVPADAPRSRHPLAKTYLLILLTTAFWGGTPVAGKLILRDIPPITAGAIRYGVAALILILAYWRQLPDFRSFRRRDVWIVFWVGIFGTFLNHILFFFGLMLAPAAHASIIAPTTSPIWTLLLAARRGQERITSGHILGVVVCLTGVVLVVHPERLISRDGATILLGDLLLLLGGVAWGIYSYLSQVAMRRLSAGVTLGLGMAFGTALLLPLALAERPWIIFRTAHLTAWGGLAYITFAGTLFSFLWWNVTLHRVGAGRTAIFSNLVPVYGVLLSWGILGERLTLIQSLGGLLAVAGVVACQGPVLPSAGRWSSRALSLLLRRPCDKDEPTP